MCPGANSSVFPAHHGRGSLNAVECFPRSSGTLHLPPSLSIEDILHQPLESYGDYPQLSDPISWFTLFLGNLSGKAFQMKYS